MPESVISVRGVSKAYRIWESPASRLMAPLRESAARVIPGAAGRWLRQSAAQSYRDFWALKDISFEVRKGACVGIIGRNGSGKSTLLQILAGTLQATHGIAHVRGRVAALLELGSGFNPEFTGRENIYLNGAVLGLTRREVDARYEEITEFADIGDFVDQPVKIYSSGMSLRLAFAVQTAVQPDVLIIDEALSVGDTPFQAKCFARIRHLQDEGCTILFVSHDTGTVQTFCQEALWLEHGVARAQGASLDVCGAYQRDCARAMGMDHAETPISDSVEPAPGRRESIWLKEDRTEFEKHARIKRSGNAKVRIVNFFLLGEDGQRKTSVRWDEELTAVYVLASADGYAGLFRLSLACVTIQGVELLSCSDRTHQFRLSLAPGGNQIVTMRIRLPLVAGQYSIYSGLFLFPDDAAFPEGTLDFSRATVADSISYAAFITILPQFNLGIYGPVHLDAGISVQPN
jgi:lipopolysaccharide transport system ATP-binding protein